MMTTIEPKWFDRFVVEAWQHPERTRNEWERLLFDEKTETVTTGRNRYNEYRQILAGIGWWNLKSNQPVGSLEAVCRAVGVNPPTSDRK